MVYVTDKGILQGSVAFSQGVEDAGRVCREQILYWITGKEEGSFGENKWVCTFNHFSFNVVKAGLLSRSCFTYSRW